MKPPPATAAVASEGTPTLATAGQVEVPTTPGLGDADVSMSAPSLKGPPAAVTPFDVEDEGERSEPSAKRQKLSTRRVGDEEFCHMDIEPYEHINKQIDGEIFDNWVDDESEISGLDDDDNLACENGSSTQTVSVWMPISELQPELSGDDLKLTDAEADRIEVECLLSMSVTTTTDGYSGKLDIPLSAKMVRAWRKKAKTETDENGTATSRMMWMRRSRLVGRDFNFLEYREDVYSPASSSSVVKLLPCMAVSNACVQEGVIATLEVADAFLQVPQPVPRKITLDGCQYIILKCLPGQRDASRLWYAYLVERLSAHVAVEVCPEQPCILRCGSDGVLLLHVDDVLIHGSEQWISGTLIPSLEKEFKLTYAMVPRRDGGALEFLKRVHVIEPNYAETMHQLPFLQKESMLVQ